MANKPAGTVGAKQVPEIENKPADHGPNQGVPDAAGDHEPAGRPRSDRLEKETAVDKS